MALPASLPERLLAPRELEGEAGSVLGAGAWKHFLWIWGGGGSLIELLPGDHIWTVGREARVETQPHTVFALAGQ